MGKVLGLKRVERRECFNFLNSKCFRFSFYRLGDTFRQINYRNKQFLCYNKKMALKYKIYVMTQNCESQNKIVVTNTSMLRQTYDFES